MDDYQKYEKWSYENNFGRGSWDRDHGIETDEKTPVDLTPYEPELKKYWDEEQSVGVIEKDGKFVGVACLVAKEVTEKESFVRKFGLSFERDIHWHAVSGLLDHLSRSPLFRAVLVTTSKIPFKLEPDIPEELEGRTNWTRHNYEYHKDIADTLKLDLEQQKASHTLGGPSPIYLPKQMKEEQDNARQFLDATRRLESQTQEHLKNFFLIKDNLFAAALFFYVYTDTKDSINDCLTEIHNRKYSVKRELLSTYFCRCDDVTDPLIVFNPESYTFFRDLGKYFCIALAQDVAGFNSDKDVAVALKHFFTTALDLPTEEPIDEQIHIPTEEVSVQKPRAALLGYVVESIVKRKFTKRRVYFPLDVLTGHMLIFGKTRAGKSFLSLILIREAIASNVRVKVFDPHGTLANRLKPSSNLEVHFTKGRMDITDELQQIYDDASTWPETNELKLLVVLDETRLLKAKNLIYCLNELGKRGVGFILITQYSTSVPAEARNVGSYFILASMSENEIERFREVTLHPGSKLITRIPRACAYLFSPHYYPDPFFIRIRKVTE